MANRPKPGNVPSGYPDGYKHAAVLRDGRTVLVRPVLPADTQCLRATLQDSDAETLRRVFPSGLPDDPDALIATITQVDYSNSFGLMASGPDGDVAGAAHYTRLPLSSDGGTTATVIVAVHPQWRRAGLARELLWTLATRAQECGISEFTGVTSPDNDAFFRLIGDPGTGRVANATAVPVSMVIDWSRAPGY